MFAIKLQLGKRVIYYRDEVISFMNNAWSDHRRRVPHSPLGWAATAASGCPHLLYLWQYVSPLGVVKLVGWQGAQVDQITDLLVDSVWMSGQEQRTGYEQVTLLDIAKLGLRMSYKGVAMDTLCGHNHSKPSHWDGRVRREWLTAVWCFAGTKMRNKGFLRNNKLSVFPVTVGTTCGHSWH